MRHLEKFISINHAFDHDGLKHASLPPFFFKGRPRVLFISGDPDKVFQSVERRGWVQIQASKLGAPSVIWVSDEQAKREIFIKAVRRQETCWKKHKGEIMFVSFDEIWSKVPDIASFFGIDDPRFEANFPSRRERISDLPLNQGKCETAE